VQLQVLLQLSLQVSRDLAATCSNTYK
jgi:hypothetical protein